MIVKGNFKFLCSCGEEHTFAATDVHFENEENEYSDEKMGEGKSYVWKYPFTCSCGKEIEIEYDFWEYPLGASNHHEINPKDIKVLQEFEFEVCLK